MQTKCASVAAVPVSMENVGSASELVQQGKASLKISVYPWDVEFDLVPYDGELLELA